MRVCIFTAREDQAAARMCLATVRHHHPKAEIVHLTDAQTPWLDGADACWRTEWDGSMDTIMGLRMTHLASLDDEETVVLDSDTLVARPLGDVWELPFDVALTRREHPTMPYNTGVMFSRCGYFWRAMSQRMQREPRYKAFLTEQEGIKEEVDSGKWQVQDLPCAEWNNGMLNAVKIPPARVLHYKGDRKQYMQAHFERGVWK